MRTIPQKAMYVAKMVARDSSHGYDNRSGHRTGNPDFACSSYVAYCYRIAGVPVPADSYTQTMKIKWKPYGFKDIAGRPGIDMRTGKGLKPGDVLVAPGKHTAMLVTVKGKKKLAEACGNPRGGTANDKPGDQTGREIRIRSYYDDGWGQCLRYTGTGGGIVEL